MRKDILTNSELFLLLKDVKGRYKARNVYLGGSYQRNPTGDSDIDVYVELDNTRKRLEALIHQSKMEEELAGIHGKKIDLHFIDSNDTRGIPLIHYLQLDIRKGIPKIAIIGTTCSGKTTLTLDLAARFKKKGVNVYPIIGGDRKLCFPRWKVEKRLEAQQWFILKQATLEIEASLQDDVDLILTDRSVLDFYAYLLVMFSRGGGLHPLRAFVEGWVPSYNLIFLLEPRTYEDDGVRPSDRFRLEVHQKLEELVRTLEIPVSPVSSRSWKPQQIFEACFEHFTDSRCGS